MTPTAAFALVFALLAAGCAAAPSPRSSPVSAAPEPVRAAPEQAHGVHGMVVFGGARLFASHLPLYHHPHDWQVVLEIAPADAGVARALRDDLAAGALVTLEPEAFDLARFAPDAREPLRDFVGSLYRGHFERGGAKVHAAVHLSVRSVLLFRRLRADGAPDAPRWLAFGTGDATFLVHVLGPRPEVDTIVAVEGAAPAAPSLVDAEPATADGMPTPAWLGQHGWRAGRVVYREAEELR
jgi:hypothetical protein